MTTLHLARTIAALALLALLTTIWLAVVGGRMAAWLLGGEVFAILVAAVILNADLRPRQRHEVK